MIIRKATKSDASSIAPLLSVIFKDMELPILKHISIEDLENTMIIAIQQDNYRYSYKNITVCEIDNKIAGILVGYKGSQEKQLDASWKEIVKISHLNYEEDIFTDRESFDNEWYLDSLVTDSNYRGMGIGTKLLKETTSIALENNENIVGLNCDKYNSNAQRLYEKMGFKKVGEVYIGSHLYNHMQLKAN